MKSISTIIVTIGWVISVQAEISAFCAASTTEVMKALAHAYTEAYGKTVQFNFASSGTLARQIDAGAPCDVFISANKAWMDHLETKARIVPSSRFNLAANRLVLIAPPGSKLEFNGKMDGRLAVGDFRSVPAGMYAKEALSHLGWLENLRPNLVMSSNVRTALMHVEHGEVSAGIVYATDAAESEKVTLVGIFPEESHSSIQYPAAACRRSSDIDGFLAYLKSSEAREILERHGFR